MNTNLVVPITLPKTNAVRKTPTRLKNSASLFANVGRCSDIYMVLKSDQSNQSKLFFNLYRSNELKAYCIRFANELNESHDYRRTYYKN